MTSQFRRFWAVLLAAALLVAGLAVLPGRSQPPAYAQTIQTPAPSLTMTRSVTVSGTGTANVTPDIAIVNLGVQTDAKTAAEALTQNNKQMQSVMTTLTQAGIAAADIRTQTIQVFPRYENPTPTAAPQGQGQAAPTAAPNQPTGFTAVNTVEVTVRNLANLGSLLDQVVAAGGNQIQGIRFDVADQTKAMDQARNAAMADAAHRAQQLAGLANAKLGAVITIVENSQGPIPYPAMAAQAAGGSVPVSPGTQAITVTVQVTWELQ